MSLPTAPCKPAGTVCRDRPVAHGRLACRVVEQALGPWLPPVFCWTKFGAEAGESPADIFARKEAERSSNGGCFLWGIGNSIRPSMLSLIEATSEPCVIFTPMLSRPARRDAAPGAVVRWRRAVGLDGASFALPDSARVTSRASSRDHHFALVCQRTETLADDGPRMQLDAFSVRNILTGTRVGSSQVTSVVRRTTPDGLGGLTYSVRCLARLVAPYLVRLSDPVVAG